jgi:hypothetical protein
MSGPTTELLNDYLKTLRSDFKDLGKEVKNIEVGLARLETEFGLAKWLLGLLLVAILKGLGFGIWWASSITKSVGTLKARFDRVEASIARVLEQNKPKPRGS